MEEERERSLMVRSRGRISLCVGEGGGRRRERKGGERGEMREEENPSRVRRRERGVREGVKRRRSRDFLDEEE